MSKIYDSFDSLIRDDDNEELMQLTVFTYSGRFPQVNTINIEESIFRINHTNTTPKKIEVDYDMTRWPFMAKYKIKTKTKKEMKELEGTVLVRAKDLEELVRASIVLKGLHCDGISDATIAEFASQQQIKELCAKYAIGIEHAPSEPTE
jgi:hypothetical protein